VILAKNKLYFEIHSVIALAIEAGEKMMSLIGKPICKVIILYNNYLPEKI